MALTGLIDFKDWCDTGDSGHREPSEGWCAFAGLRMAFLRAIRGFPGGNPAGRKYGTAQVSLVMGLSVLQLFNQHT